MSVSSRVFSWPKSETRKAVKSLSMSGRTDFSTVAGDRMQIGLGCGLGAV